MLKLDFGWRAVHRCGTALHSPTPAHPFAHSAKRALALSEAEGVGDGDHRCTLMSEVPQESARKFPRGRRRGVPPFKRRRMGHPASRTEPPDFFFALLNALDFLLLGNLFSRHLTERSAKYLLILAITLGSAKDFEHWPFLVIALEGELSAPMCSYFGSSLESSFQAAAPSWNFSFAAVHPQRPIFLWLSFVPAPLVCLSPIK